MIRFYLYLLLAVLSGFNLAAQTQEGKFSPSLEVLTNYAIDFNTRSSFILSTFENELIFDGFFKTDKEETLKWVIYTNDENFKNKSTVSKEFVSDYKTASRYYNNQGVVRIFSDLRAKDALVLSYDLVHKEMKKQHIVFDKPVVKIWDAVYFKDHVYMVCESVNYVRYVDLDMSTGEARVSALNGLNEKNDASVVGGVTWHITEDSNTLYCSYYFQDKLNKPDKITSYVSILDQKKSFMTLMIFNSSADEKMVKWVRLIGIDSNNYIMAGEYASSRAAYETTVSSGGIFLCKSDGLKISNKEFTPYTEINGFAGSVPAENGKPGHEVEIQSIAEEIKKYNSGYFLVVDYYYTNYKPLQSQSSSSQLGVEVLSSSVEYVKNGYKHTHALVMELDNNAGIKWSKSPSLSTSPIQYGYEAGKIICSKVAEKDGTIQVQMLSPSKLGVVVNAVSDKQSSVMLRGLKDIRKLPENIKSTVTVANIFPWGKDQFMIEGFNPDTQKDEKPDQALFFRARIK